MKNRTLKYYDENIEKFINDTVNNDVKKLYELFLPHIEKNSHILDLGCGSGRDSKFFIDNGYKVTAIDGSLECVKFASKHINQEVFCKTFDEIEYNNEFDGVWACASLLHLEKDKIFDILKRIEKSLKDNGCLYASFKYGEFSGYRDGRYYTDFNETSFKELVSDFRMKIADVTITGDARGDRKAEKWINIVMIKK